jgi:CRP-like cAMP-binding protein
MQRKSVGIEGPQRLGRLDFFGGLTPAQLRMLAEHVDELDAEPGEVLMGEGDQGYEAIFIEEGSVEVRQGGELINAVGPGEIVGELALLESDGRRTASVIAASPLRALSITSHSFNEVRLRMPAVGEAIASAAATHHERDRRRAEGLGG